MQMTGSSRVGGTKHGPARTLSATLYVPHHALARSRPTSSSHSILRTLTIAHPASVKRIYQRMTPPPDLHLLISWSSALG